MRRSLIVSALMALVVAGCGNDDSDQADRPPVDPTQPPAAVAAVTTDGRVVMLDPTTGEEIMAVAVGAEVDEFAGIDVSPDGQFVFFVRPRGVEDREIVRTPARGGDLRVVAAGHGPSVSPDGTQLAHVGLEPEFKTPDRVSVRPIGGEEVRDLVLESREGVDPTAFVDDVVWAGGDRLAYLIAFAEAGDAFLVGAGDDGSLWDGDRVRPEGSEGTWNEISYRSEADALAAVAGCCHPQFDAWWEIRSAEARAGGGVETLVPIGGPATSIDADTSGRHLLFVVDGVLYRWSGDGEPASVADGIVAAAW